LLKLTGERWLVEECAETGEPTLVEQEESARDAAQAEIREAPLVKATLAAFPDAELLEEGEGDTNWSKRA